MRPAGAEIVGAGAPRLDERLERLDVRVGQIGDVDVVAQTGAVGRRVVVAEHLQAAARRCAASIARGIRWISGE